MRSSARSLPSFRCAISRHYRALSLTWRALQEIQLYQAARHSFETLDFVRQYFFSVEPLDEPGRYERSYALLPRGARATATQTDLSKPLEASSSAGAKMSGDVEALKGALLDAVTSADLCTSIQEAYSAFQRTAQQLLRSKGSTSASFMDQSKSVHESYAPSGAAPLTHRLPVSAR